MLVYSRQIPFNVEVKEGILVFPDLENYELAIEYLSSLDNRFFPFWEDKISFISMRKGFNEVELAANGFDDEIFASLMNPEGVIQIGEHVFKVNMIEERVDVINANSYTKSTGITNNRNIRSFKTSENVIAILYGNEDTFIEKSSCSSNNTGWEYVNTTDGSVQYRVRYYKAGIYFTLRARMEKESGSGGYVDMYMRTYSDWTFARRNSSNCITFSGHTGGGSKSYSMRAWSSWYSLDAYAYYVDFTINDSGSNTNSQFSDNIGISCKSYNDCSQ